jgi:dihydroneopterin aldolase
MKKYEEIIEEIRDLIEERGDQTLKELAEEIYDSVIDPIIDDYELQLVEIEGRIESLEEEIEEFEIENDE